MSNEEQSFEELVREKLNQRTFSPGANSWAKAEQLLDAQQPRKRRFVFWWSAAVLLLAGITAGSYFFFSGKNEQRLSQETTTNSSANASQQNRNDQHSDAMNGATNNEANPSSSVTKEKDPLQGNANTSDQTVAQQGEQPSSEQKISAGNASPASAENASEKSVNASSAKTSSSQQHSKYSSASSSSKAGVVVSNNAASGNSSAAQNHPAKPTSSGEEKSHVKSSSSQDGQPYSSTHTSETNNRTLATQYTADTAMQRLSPAQPNIDTAQQHAAAAQINPDTAMQHVAQQHPDTSNPLQEAPPPASHSANVNYWFAEAGFTFLPGITGMLRSVNPVIGGGYCIRLGQTFGLQAGLNYTFVNHISDSSVVYASNTYSFGLETQRTEIGLRRLHYLAAPVTVWWHPDNKQAIFGGVAFHYLLATESRERTYTETFTSIKNEKVRSVFGYAQGISGGDVLLMGGYARTFGAHWTIGASFYYGVADLKKDDWYHVTKAEHNSGLRLTLQYGF